MKEKGKTFIGRFWTCGGGMALGKKNAQPGGGGGKNPVRPNRRPRPAKTRRWGDQGPLGVEQGTEKLPRMFTKQAQVVVGKWGTPQKHRTHWMFFKIVAGRGPGFCRQRRGGRP